MYRKLLSVLLIFTVLLSIGLTVGAEEQKAISDNIGKQNYLCYADTVKSYLVSRENGTLMRVEALGERVVIESYNSDFELTDSLSISYELPIFGGFYESVDSFFLAFGQENMRQDDAAETIRVVRYDKSWKRIGAASVCGTKTRKPFLFGCLRMAQYGDFLFVRTCHEMYRKSNGLLPQNSLMITVRISTMEMADAFYDESAPGYVSCSFNQYVDAQQDALISVDQGDAFPRSVVLFRCVPDEKGSLNNWEQANVLPIPGEAGVDDTLLCVGGLAVSESSYLVAGSSISWGTGNDVRNIYVTVTPKCAFSEDTTKVNWITDYPVDDFSYVGKVSAPHLVAVDDGFLILWTVNGKLNYTILNQEGERTGNIMTANAALSDCKPIYAGGNVYWYCTDNSTLSFYCIDMASPETVEVILPQEQVNPTETFESSEPTTPTEPTEPPEECPSLIYSDVPGETYWAHQGIDFVIRNGLFNGMSARSFMPDIQMTRAMLVTVLWRSAGMPMCESNPFSDVPENGWYTDAVRWASACNIVNGTGAGRFDPNGNVTREQMAAILYRYAIYSGKDTQQRASLSEFADECRVSSWASNAMCWSVAQGIISGMESHGTRVLLPQENATRAQVATILMRYLQEE